MSSSSRTAEPEQIQTQTQTFSGPSHPRQIHKRPQLKRDLPQPNSGWHYYLLFTILGISAWAAFLLYATNQERLASSVFRQVNVNLRENRKVAESLGENVIPQPKVLLGGQPWISGAINLLQGNVDVSFRIQGSKGAGTVYFTSVRKTKGAEFTILRFKVICDSGEIISLKDGL